MYAIIETGGKQYRVREGDVVNVEKLPGEPGAKITFDHVLLVGDAETAKVGQPAVAGAVVETEIVGKARGPKLTVFRMKRRKNMRRKQGHRQTYTALKVTAIRA